jgi:hypothetical protein
VTTRQVYGVEGSRQTRFDGGHPDLAPIRTPAGRAVDVRPAPREGFPSLSRGIDDIQRCRVALLGKECDPVSARRDPGREEDGRRLDDDRSDRKLETVFPLHAANDREPLPVRGPVRARIRNTHDHFPGGPTGERGQRERPSAQLLAKEDRHLTGRGDRQDIGPGKVEGSRLGVVGTGRVHSQRFVQPPGAIDDRLAVRSEARVGDRAAAEGQAVEGRGLCRRRL